MNHYVYEVENLVNGKRYIGKHSTELDFFDDDYYGSGTLIQKAIKKYGKNNFKRKVLRQCSTEQEAFIAESEEIENVKAYENSCYYNICKGGEGCICGSKIKKSPPNTSKNPKVFNIEKYISNIEGNFDAVKGGIIYKLQYYAGYLLNQGFDDEAIRERLQCVSQECFRKNKYDIKKQHEIIETVLDYIFNLKEQELLELYTQRVVNVFSSELDEINKLNGKVLRKLAVVSLLVYKMFSESYESYVKIDFALLCNLSNMVCKKDKTTELWSQLVNCGYIEISNDENKYRIPSVKFSGEDLFKTLTDITNSSYLVLNFYNGDKSVIQCRQCNNFTRTNKNRTKKYCSDCSSYIPMGIKSKICIDCGKEFIVVAKNTRANRCNSCYEKYRHEYDRVRKQRQR